MLQTIITTILKRPYVVLFLLSYIIIAVRVVNWRWMFSFLFLGYLIAFLSEYLSINYGFPYGWYFYKYENLTGEWLNHGVPVWDSVSYVFMCFAGLYTAHLLMDSKTHVLTQKKKQLAVVFLSALLVTLLDIIVDPVTHMGKKWFLGEIYYYPEPGWYFDITMANFAGWFLVSFLINACGEFLLKFSQKVKITKLNSFLSVGLYFGIFGFGLSIAVYLNIWLLIVADLFWLFLVLALFLYKKHGS